MCEAWNGFKEGKWQEEINVRDFIQLNYKEYKGDDSFLTGATERTSQLMAAVQGLFKKERQNGGVLDVDTDTVTAARKELSEKGYSVLVGRAPDKSVRYRKLLKLTGKGVEILEEND